MTKITERKPKCVCEIVEHPEGRFQIGRRQYRPEWPRGSTVGLETAHKIVRAGMDVAQEHYDKTNHRPQEIMVEYYSGKEMRVILID